MRVLVAYASPAGSTRGVAERIADRLRLAGEEADALPVFALEGLEAGYDAVIVGSAVHNGKWMPEARAFVDAHSTELRGMPCWLFSVSSVGDANSALGGWGTRLVRKMAPMPTDARDLLGRTGARGHRNFAGRLVPRHWGRMGHLFVRLTGGRFGDHRNWADIEAWADGIAASLAMPA